MPGGNFKAKAGMTGTLTEVLLKLSTQDLRKLASMVKCCYDDASSKAVNVEVIRVKFMGILKTAGIATTDSEPASSSIPSGWTSCAQTGAQTSAQTSFQLIPIATRHRTQCRAGRPP